MSKPPPQSFPFPVWQNATTTGPDVVSNITHSVKLQALTKHCVVNQENGVFHLRVFRESGMKPGSYSCDIHKFIGGKWVPFPKDSKKYQSPEVPREAIPTQVGSQTFWTLGEMTEEMKGELLRILPALDSEM